jgi:hypothetical protein
MPAADAFTERVQRGWRSARLARHRARLPRYLFLAVLAVLLLLGLRAAVFPPSVGTPESRPPSTDLPSQAFALQFARAYLSYDAGRPGIRAKALAPFLGAGRLPDDAGLIPTEGSQSVRWAHVASDQPALSGGRAITVAASVSTQALPLYLTVTVRHPPGSPLQIGGYPALVGPPAIVASATADGDPVEDPALRTVLDRVLRNYLASAVRDLEADLSADAGVSLPTRRLRLREVTEISWLGSAGSGAVLATLVATDAAGTSYTLAYELGIERRERPYVEFIETVPTGT